MSTYAVTAAALPGDGLSIGALRRRSVRYWLAAVGLFGIASFYVTPTVAALRLPQTKAPLPAMSLPLIRFAPFSIPKLHRPAVPPPVPKASATRHVVRRAPATRAPVLKTTRTLVAPVSASKQPAPPADPLATVPTLDSGVGVPVELPPDPVPAPAEPQPAGDPAALTPQSVSKASVVNGTRQLRTMSAGGGAPVTEPAAAPTANDVHAPAPAAPAAPPADPVVAPAAAAPVVDPTVVSAPGPAPVDPVVTVAPVTVTTPDPPQITPTAPAGIGLPSAAPAQPDQGPAADSTPQRGDPGGLPAGQVSAGGSSASGSDPGSVLDSTGSPAVDTATPESIDLPSPDPAAVPGSGPSPPASVSIVTTDDGSLSVDASTGATTWTIGGGDVTVTIDGLAPVTFHNVSSISAGGADDTLVGPAADTTWTIDGPDAGSVAGISFTGFEHLLGSAGNQDTFVLEQTGSVAGVIDGGPGGYDTLVLDGGWNTVESTPVDGSSGTLTLDGVVVRYAGLEPITSTGTAADVVFNLPSGSVTATLTTSGSNLLLSGGGAFEATSFVAPTHSLTINFGSGGDSLALGSIGSVYTGAIAVHGGAGSDTFASPDLDGVWHLTGIDSGDYQATGGPKVTFDGIENLTGAATHADSFEFQDGGAVTGTIADGAGTLTVAVAGFVRVSGDYDFVQQTQTIPYAGSASGTATNANVLTVGGMSGTGLIGVNAFDNPLGLQGTLSSFGLAVVTDGTHAWDLFQGTIVDPSFVGFGGSLSAGLANLTVTVNAGSGGTYLNTHASPISVATGGSPVSLDFSTGVIAASTTFSLTISDFVHLSGTFTFGLGLGTSVDVATGLSAGDVATTAPGLSELTAAADCSGSALGRTGDYSMICNLPVSAFTIAASDINVFVGYANGLDPGSDGALQRSELPSDAVGLFASDIDVGLVLMSAKPTLLPGVDLLGLKFYALEATAGDIELVGVPELWLGADNIEVKVNGGKSWPNPLAPAPAIDFATSFGGSGYTIPTGGTPIVVDFAGPVIGASAEKVLFRVSDFVYVSGSFSFEKGATQYVDVRTGLQPLTGVQKTALYGASSTESDTDPGGTTLAHKADDSIIWNLPVDTIDIGLGSVDIFVGYSEGLDAAAADGDLTQPELEAAHAVGLFLDNVSLGVVVMRARTVTGALGLNGALLKFFALKVDAANVVLLGVPELWLSANNLEVRVNQGSFTPGVWPGGLTGPPPVVDFVLSFGSGGYSVPTGGAPVPIDYTGPVVGASADNVLFRVSDFVYVSGGFSFNKGATQYVDVQTNLGVLTTIQKDALFGNMQVSDTDPGGTTLARSTDGSIIWNLPVQTIEFGLDAVDVFVGYTDSLDAAAADGNLTQSELEAANAVGLFLENVSLGMVLMRAMPVTSSPLPPTGLNASLLKFFALKVQASTVALLGVPELTLSTTNLEIRVNQGSFTPGVWPGLPGARAPPVIDFGLSFPDGTYGPTDGLPDGYHVPTNTSGAFVALTYSDPVVGASADKVLLRISDFVYVTGGFSFNKGPVEYVDVETNLSLNSAQKLALFGAMQVSDTDPGGTTLARSSDGRHIWNLPVQTIDFGLNGVDVFVGYTDSLDAAAADGHLVQSELEAANAIGLLLANVNLGLALMRAEPGTGGGTLDAAQLKFFSLKADAGTVALLGIPEFTLTVTNLEVRVNQGSFVPGAWPALPGNAPPVIDFALSYPDDTYLPADGDSLPDGYHVQTDTAGHFVALTFDTPVIGVSADNVLLRISDFVYVTGGFSFNKGPVEYVDVETNLSLTEPQKLALFGTMDVSDTDPGGQTLARSSDGKHIWNLPVETIDFGLNGVDVFVGYTDGLDAAAADGDLMQSELEAANAIGVFLDEVTLGLALFRAQFVAGAGSLNAAQLKFFSLKADASTIALLGIPEFTLTATNMEVRVNQGSFVPGAWPALPGNAPPVIDFALSFPDGAYEPPDGDGLPDGYHVATNTSGAFVALTYDTPVIGVSADNVLLRISDFVYVTGGFSFNKGPVEYVDVNTNLNLNVAERTLVFGTMDVSDTDPGGTSTAVSSDAAHIWNLPVETLDFGLNGVDLFVGYTSGLDAAAADGNLELSELTAADAIGVFLDNVTLGLALFRTQFIAGVGTLNAAQLKFFSLKADASTIALVGIPELSLSASNLEVRLNQGSFVQGVWPALPGAAPPVIDFALSFPDDTYLPADGDTDPDGYHVATNTSGAFVALTYDSPVIGVSADNVLLRISDFVYVTGSFSFNKGPTHEVDVRTGLSTLQAAGLLASLPNSDTDPGPGTTAIKGDGSIIWNLPVQTLEIGLAGVDVFVGYSDGLDAAAADGNLVPSELEAAHAIGVYLDNVSLGMVLMDALPTSSPVLDLARLKFFALQANADNLGLTGVPEIVIDAHGAEVKVNQGSFTQGLWPALPGGAPPIVDFALSFPDDTYSPADGDSEPDDYHVPTNTSGAFIPLAFDSPLIAGGAERIDIQLSQFVYLTGSVYFEKGPVMTVPLVGGVLGNPADVLSQLGITIPGNILSLTTTEIETMTIGAANVEAFVGLHGPYWVDTNGNGIIDRDGSGQIVDSEVNHDAIGLVLDNLNFGMLLGTPTNPVDPRRYVALKASANSIRLVGIPGLTAEADNIDVELNISSPTAFGLPLLPVIDFSGLSGGFFGVKTGERNPDGSYKTINLDMSAALVRARAAWIQLDLFGVVTVQGSIAFNLGPQEDVILSDGSHHHVTTMTIGAAHVSAFVGANGPYVLDKNGTLNPSAVGLQITELNMGLFVGTDTTGPSPGTFVALSLDIQHFGAVNIPGITFDGTLSVQLNLGASLMSGGSAINFVTSFPVATGHPTAGFEVDTGDPDSPVLLNFTGFLINVEFAGTLSILSVFSIAGILVIQADSSSLKVFAAGVMKIGPDIGGGTSLVDIQALGVLILNSQGVAADLDIDLSLGIPELGLNVSARVIVNNTGVDQSIVIPDRLLTEINTYAAGSDADAALAATLKARLGTCGSSKCYTVHGGAPRIFSSPGVPDMTAVAILLGTQSGVVTYEAPGSYVVVILSGSFNFLNFATASGLAAISIRSNAFEMVGQLSFTIGPLSFGVNGSIGIYPDGVALHLAVHLNVNLLSLFDLNANGTLDIDTTGSNNYFRLSLSGNISVLSIISISGSITIVVDHSAWSITVPSSNPLSAHFGPLSLSAYGNIHSNGHFDLTFTGGITLGDSSTGISGTGTVHASFDGTHFSFSVGGSFSAHFLGVDLFSISATGSITGTLGQSVVFKVHVEGSGWFLETVLKIVRMTVDAAEELGLAVVNFLGSIGCDISNFFDPGSCEEWVDVEKPENEWIEELKSFDLTIATITLPSSLTNVVAPPPAPQLASLNLGSGVLTLNVGSLGVNRNVGKSGSTPIADEGYQVTYLGGSSISGRSRLRVIAFGKTEDFDGVISIYSDFGSGDDTLQVMPGVPVPLEAHGGDGNDSLSYLGSNSAKLYGDAGNDSLGVGSAATGNTSSLVLDGGANDDTLTNDSSSGATLTGGEGNDTIFGGGGGDSISGGNGNDTLQGRGGQDAVSGDAGDDFYREYVTDLVANESFSGGANATTTTGDTVQITGTSSSDDFRVTVSGSTVTFSRYSGSTLLGSLNITTTENLTMRGIGGGDSYLLNGAFDTAGLKRVTADLSSGAIDLNGDGTADLTAHAGADTVTMNLSSANDTATLGTSSSGSNTTVNWSGHYFLTAINSAVADNDVLTINAGDGNDVLNGGSVTGVLWRHVNLMGGSGDDKISGTPDDDTIDSGTGNDIVSGGGGTDTFVDASGTDTLVEFGAVDFGLWHNLFAEGTATLAGAGETRAVSSFASATAEDPSVFELANLFGSPTGGERNVFQVGSATSSMVVNGVNHSALTPWTGTATLNGYGGNDEYIVDLNGLNGGSVTVLEDGASAGGSDTLTVEGTDGADTGHAADGAVQSGLATTVFTLDNASISPAALTVSSQIETVGLYLCGGADVFAVRTIDTAPLTLDAGSGNDTILVGSNGNEAAVTNSGGTLDGIDAALTISGGTGSDLLAVDDSGDATPNSGTLTATALNGLGLVSGGIAYSNFDTLTVDLGSANDTFTVTSTMGGSTTVDGNGGNDLFVVQSAAGTLTVNGGSGDDWFDMLAAAGTVNLNGQDGNDTFELGSNAAATAGVDTGGNVNAIAGALALDGGTGTTDAAYLDETGDGSSVGNDGRLTATTITGLSLGAGITYTGLDSLTVALGAGGTRFDVLSTSTDTEVDTGGGNDTVNVSSDAPANLGTLNLLAGHLTIDGQGGGGDLLNLSDLGDAVANSGELTSSLLTGLGTAGVGYSNVEVLNIQLGRGDDRFDVRSTNALTVTTTRAGPGSDTVNVSSDAPANFGTTSGIAGHLIVDGQGGTGDTLNVSDAGDAAPSNGTLTSTDLTGLGTAGISYAGLEFLRIDLGSGGDTFTIASTHVGQTTLNAWGRDDNLDVQTISGLTYVNGGDGADAFFVGSTAPGTDGILDGISALLQVDGGAGHDTLTAFDTGDSTPNTGALTLDTITGLGMAVGIGYGNLEELTIDLGSGGDTFTILSTHAGLTTLNTGPGADTVDIETIAGPTFVNGQAGDDSITVNGDLASPGPLNGIGALLTLDGGAGSDAYLVNTFGNGDSTIDVFDTGFDGGVNTLTINGTSAADQFLFRAGLVASLTGLAAGAYTHAELVNYDGQITGGLTVNGLEGDDGFAFDDNSAATTVNGGTGADSFQVGQLFGRPELFLTSVDLTTTTRGDLSNGVSFATTLNGGEGGDAFSIFHNRAPLATNGDAGDDTFVIRTFAAVDDFTTLNSGTGADLVQYVENAPLSIDGGDGFDTVLVIGTEFDDSFTITADGVTGSGLQVSMAKVERVTIDGVEGNDHFVVLATAATVDTWIYGGLGSDTTDVGDPVTGLAGVQGALHVYGGDDPNGTPLFPAPVLLPGESTGPLPVPSNPNFLMIESHQVDTLNVNDGGVAAGQAGTLTSSSVSGLGMGAAGIVYFDLEVVNVHLGSGDDTFTIATTHAGTTTLTGGAGGDSVSVLSIAGPTLVAGNGGDDTITVGSPAGTLTGIGSLLAVDGGSGSDRLVVNDSGETADSLGTLTQTSLTGLGMDGAGDVSIYSVDPHGAAFTIALAGFGSASFGAGADAAAVQAGLQQLMFPTGSCGSAGTSRCSQSVFVWQLGGELVIGFQGEVTGAAPALTSTGTDVSRGDGIDYANVENLDISLGSGNDRFNVRGTLPVTSLSTGAGDDVVYVSDAADLGSLPAAASSATGDLAALQAQILYGTVTVDDQVFHGSLALVAGALSIDAGLGSNTLGIGDRADTSARTATLTSSSLVGLAPAPIAYGATGGDLAGEGFWALQSDSGLFGRGIDVYGGSGGNTFTVTSVLTSDVTPAPFGETVTSLFTGEGTDTVTVSVAAGPARALMVDGQGGNDTIDGSGSTLPLVVFGGDGSDTVAGGSAGDTLFGDTGRVEYLRPGGAGGYDVVLGGAPIAAYHSAPAGPDGDFITADIVYTDGFTGPSTDDTIAGNAGDDVVLGGPGADAIDAGTENDIVLGDNGRVVFDPALPILVETQQPGSGGNDAIAGGLGDDVLFGGAGSDTITDTGGRNVVVGDNGYVAWATVGGVYEIVTVSATDSGTGGPDTITISGPGANFVVGGTGGDTITTGQSNDLIFGDYGLITGAIPAVDLPSGSAAYTYTSIFTGAADGGGDDVISAGDGRNVVIGGQGGDTISSGSGDDDLIGGANLPAVQDGADRIDGGGGNDVIAGDNALILRRGDAVSLRVRTLTGATIYSIDLAGNVVANVAGASQLDPTGVAERTIVLFDSGTTDPTTFGNDYLAGGAGDDVVFGQMGNDVIQGDGSTSLAVGSFAAPGASAEDFAGQGKDGNDYVEGGGGSDLIFGGLGQDDIIGGNSPLYLPAGAPRPDGVDVIFGGAGTDIGLNDPGDTSGNGHSRDADVIVGDNGAIYRLVGPTGQFLSFNYDSYAGETQRIVPRAVQLLDYSPTGDEGYTTCDPTDPDDCWVVTNAHPSNIGGGDTLHGEGGNDVVYGGTGSDTIFGDGQDDQLYGNSGGDWISGGTGDDGVLGDGGLLEVARNGVAEPLFGLAATTQLVLGTGDADSDDIVVTVNVTGRLNYTAIEQPFFVGANDIVYGGLGNDFLHGGGGDDAMSGAEAPPLYYDNGHNPIGVLASLAAYYTAGNVLGFSSATKTFRYFNANDPFEKIMVAPGIDFLLNFVSATTFDATTPQTVVDDGQDVLFGDGGNDWMVGGTNQDFLFGGYGIDLLQADDNLDSTRVDVSVTYSTLCATVTAYSSSSHEAGELCEELYDIQYDDLHHKSYDPTHDLDEWVESVTDDIDCVFTADEAATLIRFAQALKPGYDPLANDTVDPRSTGPTNADLAFGGAGHDILIANTAGDRLIDYENFFNSYYFPWEGNGWGEQKPTVIDDNHEDVVQLLYDASLALGADPTRPEAPSSWHDQSNPSYRNGEPFGELGLLDPGDEDWSEEAGHNWWPSWDGGLNPDLCDVEGHPDSGSLGLIVLKTPSAHPQAIEDIRNVDETAESLLNRIVVRGQLTAAESASLSWDNQEALNDLICNGLVVKVGGVWVASDKTWLALGLAGAPRITDVDWSGKLTPTTPITISGTGDATDTITIYWDGTHAVGTGIVDADGRWSVVVFVPVGWHDLTATQTVNQLPHVGLTSDESCDVDVTVYPDPPRITFTSTPGPTTSSTPVTVSGTGDAGDSVALYDGSRYVGSATVNAAGNWTLTVNLTVGKHALTATQTWSHSLTSNASASASVTVYAPPPAPTITGLPVGTLATFSVSGTGVAGDTVTLYEGTTALGTALVGSGGGWSLTITLSLGKHTFTAKQTDPVSGFTGNASSSASTTVYAQPPAPTITSVSTPAATKTTTPVTVTGTGIAADKITLYDGSTAIGTVTVASNGTWSLTVQLAVGVHSLTATQTLVAAVTSVASAAVSVTVYPPPPAAPSISASATATTSSSVTLSGSGVAGNTITVYDGTTAIGTVTVAANGSWSLVATLALGAHALSATQTDAVWGFTSVKSSTVTVTVYAPPPPPVISSFTTPAPTHTTTNVTFSGTGVAGETITLYDGSTAVGTATVASNGKWTLTVKLAAGTHTMTATQTLVAGVTSAASSAVTVIVPSH